MDFYGKDQTRDIWIHNPEFYHISIVHFKEQEESFQMMY